ncbi:MAG: extracellular solute-binding protein [Chitinivibrionales bacterium]|nr:extracellular solute-binding protein [Chitinivibrionales bacterium]
MFPRRSPMNKKKKAGGSRVINGVGLFVIAVAYVSAIYNTFTVKREMEWGGKKIIRISHWQLEAGFREAFDWVIKEYEKIHPDYKVIQLAINDRTYKQFMTTQLIGGTAPDLIQLGRFKGSGENVNARFFYPLSEEVFKPNPYNADNELKEMPWIYTFKHGLEFNWDENNLDYYSIGVSAVSQRMAYNKTLLKKITGKSKPPRNFRELIDLCEQIKEYSEKTGDNIFPIASSRYQGKKVMSRLAGSVGVEDIAQKIDRNFDYEEDIGYEAFLSWMEKDVGFNAKEDSIGQVIADEISQYFEPGFMAKGRMDAAFSFIQQKSLMIAAGSWDANTLVQQSKDAGFVIGFTDFIRVSRDHPKYGKYVKLKTAESRKGNNVPFGLCRFSKYPDVALDFLKFFSSQEIAGEFCRRAGWLCAIRGAENVDFLKPFEPDYRGLPTGKGVKYAGQQTQAMAGQLEWQLQSGDIDYSEYITKFTNRYPDYAMKDFLGHMNNFKNSLVPASHDLSDVSLMMKFNDDPSQEPRMLQRLKYKNEAYATFWVKLQGTVYDMVNITTHKENKRIQSVKETSHFNTFMKEFPNLPETGRN